MPHSNPTKTGPAEPDATADESLSGPPSATIEGSIVSCLANAQYHACREAFLDTVHRWMMFFVIVLGAAALTDVLPKIVENIFGVKPDANTIKEICAAGASILAALDLTFDLSNRARSHSMMKRRYFELLAALRKGEKSPSDVRVCIEEFSADEEPVYKVLYLACWNAAQETVFGQTALKYKIGPVGNLFKNWWRRPAASYPVQSANARI